MTSLILRTATRYLLPLLLLFSVFLLLRGHNEPGGGFVGGLVASAMYSLHVIAHGMGSSRPSLPWPPTTLIAIGLALAAGSGAAALLAGLPLLTTLWTARPEPLVGELGTALLFDTGVYLAVLGAVLLTVFSLMEE